MRTVPKTEICLASVVVPCVVGEGRTLSLGLFCDSQDQMPPKAAEHLISGAEEVGQKQALCSGFRGKADRRAPLSDFTVCKQEATETPKDLQGVSGF